MTETLAKEGATRGAGLALLDEFRRRMGRTYAEHRNSDRGPGRHVFVSRLSPYLRRRLVTEQETVRAAVSAHGPAAAEAFVREVFWRGYFKGWLERRPQIWAAYLQGLQQDVAAVAADPALADGIAAAEQGRTGLACFDAWAQELTTTGYLHNHARMWFASIWIFTLRLPWRLGADFFLRHLLDGDPASNTLSWRWVGGLHTRGKFYPAQAWNIARFTEGRFTPAETELAEVVAGLEAEEPEGLPPPSPLRIPQAPQPGRPTALLITEEDCRLEEHDLAGLDIRTAATLAASPLRSPRRVAEAVLRFEAEALADAASRAGFEATTLQAAAPEALVDWAAAAGVTQIATGYVTRGPLHDWLAQAAPLLEARGITLCEWRREWDAAIWPHASAGFFKVKEQIPVILDRFESRS
jgi:deoxyribodipyrimidine photo-lyase